MSAADPVATAARFLDPCQCEDGGAAGCSSGALLVALLRRAALQIGAGIVTGNLLVVWLASVIAEHVSVVPSALPMLAASLIMVTVGAAWRHPSC